MISKLSFVNLAAWQCEVLQVSLAGPGETECMRDKVGGMAVLAHHAVVMVVIIFLIRQPDSCSRCGISAVMRKMRCMAAVCCK